MNDDFERDIGRSIEQLHPDLDAARDAGIDTSSMSLDINGNVVRRVDDPRVTAADQPYDPSTAWRH